MIKKANPLDLSSHFCAARKDLKRPIDCYDGISPIITFFNDMGFAADPANKDRFILATQKDTYALTYGIASSGSDMRAFLRLESGKKDFPGIRIAGDDTKSVFEVGPLDRGEKAIDPAIVKTPQDVIVKLRRNLNQFEDLRPLLSGNPRTPVSQIPAAKRIEAPSGGARQVLPRHGSSVVRVKGAKPTDPTPDK
jgi:hypothetical protein